MNTDRDNFHDWAREKPETGFSTISRPDFYDEPAAPIVRWGRIVVFAVVAAGLIGGFKLFAGL